MLALQENMERNNHMSNANNPAKVELPIATAEHLRAVMDGQCKRLAIASGTEEYRQMVAVFTTLDMAITKARSNRVIEGVK